MPNEIKQYLREDMIDNIYNRFSNIFIIKYDENAKINGKYFGHLLLKVKVEKEKDKKSISINDFVEFRSDKIKWKNGNVCLVNPYWVKNYIETEKLPIRVSILKSKINKENNKREYFTDYEYINMTYKQFISRKMYEEYREETYGVLEAYSNFQIRRKKVGYYKALNETAKHYLIEHDILREVIIPKINNSLKGYKKEWNKLYVKSLAHDKAKRAIDKLINENKEEKMGEVIDFSERFHT